MISVSVTSQAEFDLRSNYFGTRKVRARAVRAFPEAAARAAGSCAGGRRDLLHGPKQCRAGSFFRRGLLCPNQHKFAWHCIEGNLRWAQRKAVVGTEGWWRCRLCQVDLSPRWEINMSLFSQTSRKCSHFSFLWCLLFGVSLS